MQNKRGKSRAKIIIGVVVCIAIVFCGWYLFSRYGNMSQAKEMVSAYAVETPLGDRQAEVERQVSLDLYRMRGTYFQSVDQIAEVSDTGEIVYAVENERFPTDYITVQKKHGKVEITVTEGEKKDLWVRQMNGKIYLNGQRMKDCENWLVSFF